MIRRLPLHPCHGCGKMVRNVICKTCKQKHLDVIEGKQRVLE